MIPTISNGSAVFSMYELGRQKGYELCCVMGFDLVFVQDKFWADDKKVITVTEEIPNFTVMSQLWDNTMIVDGKKESLWKSGLTGFPVVDDDSVQLLPVSDRVFRPHRLNPKMKKLHLGGLVGKSGWTTVNIQPGPNVDIVGNVTDLSMFESGSVSQIYASHVLEHLSLPELATALKEYHRTLCPSGLLFISVPDMMALSKMLIQPGLEPAEQFDILLMMFGGQSDNTDFHKIGFTKPLLRAMACDAGFPAMAIVDEFDVFKDCSSLRKNGVLISLNAVLRK